jgi:hypothetical protein
MPNGHHSPWNLVICTSLDNTFKVASKATVVDKDGTHCKLTKGGVLNVMNESTEIIAWVRAHWVIVNLLFS